MDTYRFAILGGGMVAGYAARELVAHGLRAGELTIVSAEPVPPYERPPLSKGFLAGREDEPAIFINDPGFYTEHGIDLRLGTEVVAVDLRKRLLLTRAGEAIGFEQLLIATGARARTLDVAGADLDGIHYLRSLADARRIRTEAAGARRAVVVGSGFIGMEVAAVLAQQGVETTMVFPDERAWQRVFTPEMSAFFERYYEARGVRLLPSRRAARFEGWGRVHTVVLDDGQHVRADLVVAGIGVTPATEPLEGSGLALDNGVVVDECLESREAQVYAAGDVANYYDALFATRRRMEHWDNAVEQGKHGARALLGMREPFIHVPYFFSDVFDLSYEFWGDPAGADRVVYRGEVAAGRFSAWWLRESRPVAAFVMNRPDEERELAPASIAQRLPLSVTALEDERTPLQSVVG